MRRNMGKRGVLLMTVLAALCTAGCANGRTDLPEGSSAAVSERKDDGQVSDEQKSDAGNLESQPEKQSDVQSESNTEADIKDNKAGAEIELDELIGSTLPLRSYKYYITEATAIDFDIKDYVVEDESEFALWNKDDLFRVSVIQDECSDVMNVVPVEIHSDRKYKALRFDDELYLVDVLSGVEIWKGDIGVSLTAECNLGLFHDGRTEITVVDVLGNGGKQLCIKTYDSGTGYIRQGMEIFDIDSMSFVEYENSDEYFIDTLKEAVQQYANDGKEIKEGYKFYLSDSDWNYTGGFRPEFDEDCMYQTMRVDYLPKKGELRSEDTYLCRLKAIYRYDSDKNMFVVDHVEQDENY